MDSYTDNPFHHSGVSDNDTVSRQHRPRNSFGASDDNSYRVTSQVSFTIGDSSDCDSSVSTTRSGTTGTETQSYVNNDDEVCGLVTTNCCNANPWHKYHFHCDHKCNEGENSLQPKGGKDGADNERDFNWQRRSRGASLSNTTRLVQNSLDYSLAQLSDTEDNCPSDGREGGRNFWRNWGKWRILIACAIVQLFSALMVSLQSPFYPSEAEKKGASATEYGFVFGVFELTVFIIAPFYGLKINNWNPKLVFNIGVCTAAVSSIIFGVLDKIDNRQYFIASCALVRALEAVGESAVVTASFVIVASSFPDSVASTFAVLETFYSIGLISGPIVGSLLYEIGGYPLPFMVIGGGLLASAFLTCIILPSSEQISEHQRNGDPVVISSYKSFRLLGSAPVLVSAICIIIGAMSISYLQATLEPHLRQFGLSQLSLGSILIINGAVYTITAPFWGILCDKVLQLKLVTFCGAAILICGYSLVGPVPIFKFQQSVWIVALGLALQGIGLGAVLVASFISILRNAICSELVESPSTHGLVSSLWTSMFSLGSFLGPSLSGILYDAVGFANGTIVIIALLLIMMCMLVLFVCYSDAEMNSFNYDENEPLLSTSVPESAYSEHSPNVPAVINNSWSPQRGHRNSYGAT